MQESLFESEQAGIPSWVYVIGAQHSSVVKIGKAVDVPKRLRGLQTGNPNKLVTRWQTPGGRPLESTLHRKFDQFRLEGEWFDFGNEDPIALIRKAAGHADSEGLVLPSPIPAADSPKAAYLVIADTLRSRIAEDLYSDYNNKLPPGVELRREFGVSLETVRRALDALKAEGRIASQPGLGTYIVPVAGKSDHRIAQELGAQQYGSRSVRRPDGPHAATLEEVITDHRLRRVEQSPAPLREAAFGDDGQEYFAYEDWRKHCKAHPDPLAWREFAMLWLQCE